MNAVARAVRCGRCGERYSPVAYAALERVMTLDRTLLQPITTAWPDEVKVLVRSCKACAGPIACLSRHQD